LSYVRHLCLFAHSVVFFFVFLRLVYPMLPVFLECSFVIVPSEFYNVYLSNKPCHFQNTEYLTDVTLRDYYYPYSRCIDPVIIIKR
jgi:hypothetical protein